MVHPVTGCLSQPSYPSASPSDGESEHARDPASPTDDIRSENGDMVSLVSPPYSAIASARLIWGQIIFWVWLDREKEHTQDDRDEPTTTPMELSCLRFVVCGPNGYSQNGAP